MPPRFLLNSSAAYEWALSITYTFNQAQNFTANGLHGARILQTVDDTSREFADALHGFNFLRRTFLRPKLSRGDPQRPATAEHVSPSITPAYVHHHVLSHTFAHTLFYPCTF